MPLITISHIPFDVHTHLLLSQSGSLASMVASERAHEGRQHLLSYCCADLRQCRDSKLRQHRDLCTLSAEVFALCSVLDVANSFVAILRCVFAFVGATTALSNEYFAPSATSQQAT